MSETGAIQLDLLRFAVGGVPFGVDAEQVAAVDAYTDDGAHDLFWFHRELPFGDAPPGYASPAVLTVKTPGREPYRLIIDAMSDIGRCDPKDIRLFPAHLEEWAMRRGMWGILLQQGTMVLLVDLLTLQQNRLTADDAIHEGDP